MAFVLHTYANGSDSRVRLTRKRMEERVTQTTTAPLSGDSPASPLTVYMYMR